METFAGSGDPGIADGVGREARFNLHGGVSVGAENTRLYAADVGSHRLRSVTVVPAQDAVAWSAASGLPGRDIVYGAVVDGFGNAYVAGSEYTGLDGVEDWAMYVHKVLARANTHPPPRVGFSCPLAPSGRLFSRQQPVDDASRRGMVVADHEDRKGKKRRFRRMQIVQDVHGLSDVFQLTSPP